MAEVPEKETVYRFKKRNTATGIWEYPKKKCTRKRIKRQRGFIIAGTAEEVLAAHVNESGQYNPPKDGAN